MENRRRHKRYARRCTTEYTTNHKTYQGISSDFSMDGIYIRTTHPIAPDSTLDMVVHLPDGSTSQLAGKVKRASISAAGRMLGTLDYSIRNGMGVEITKRDANYLRFMSSLLPGKEPVPQASADREPAETAKPVSPSLETGIPRPLFTDLLASQEALVSLLERKGILSRAEVLEELKRLKK